MSMEMLKSIHRKAAGISRDDQLMAPSGFVAGGDGAPAIVFPSPNTVAVFEDFLGFADTGVPTRYNDVWAIGTSDTGQQIPATQMGVSSPLTNGVFSMTSSATSTQTPDGGCQSITGALNWKANQGRLRYSARIRTATLAGNTVFAGFSDTAGNEFPNYDTGAGFVTPAADYVGFTWSGEGGATQQAYRLVAGKAGVDQSAATGITPKANVYDVLGIEVSPDGNVVNGYINGCPVAQISSAAVTPTVALAPGVWRANTDAAANVVAIDWVNVSSARDTGT